MGRIPSLYRPCSCPYVPCFHNPGEAHQAAKRRLMAYSDEVEALGFFHKIWNRGAIAGRFAAILAELKATDWRWARDAWLRKRA